MPLTQLSLLVLVVCIGFSSMAQAETLKAQITQTHALPNLAISPAEHGMIGISFLIRPASYPYVEMTFPGTPAAQAGLLPGDQILAVNQATMFGLSSQAVDEAISDRPGDQISFRVYRNGVVFNKTLVVASRPLLSPK